MRQSSIADLPLFKRGKVRDLYALDDSLLIVATDRISCFDVVLPTPIPGKGQVLTQMSGFWFEKTRTVIANHCQTLDVPPVISDAAVRQSLEGRTMVVRKAVALPVEAVVRGYLSGSGWREYRREGSVCGIALPAGLRESEQLPEPIFTPATKAESGEHDENITFEQTKEIVGTELAERVRDLSLELYAYAAEFAASRGIIIADTKFEFGMADGELLLIDEALTPDSSRFWPADLYEPGRPQPSFDKQFVRDYLESIGFNKQPPAPGLPSEIVDKTTEKYREALQLLTTGAPETGMEPKARGR